MVVNLIIGMMFALAPVAGDTLHLGARGLTPFSPSSADTPVTVETRGPFGPGVAHANESVMAGCPNHPSPIAGRLLNGSEHGSRQALRLIGHRMVRLMKGQKVTGSYGEPCVSIDRSGGTPSSDSYFFRQAPERYESVTTTVLLR